MSKPLLLDLSPLDQIRHTEAECARRIVQARAAAEAVEATAKKQATSLLNDASVAGRRAGDARRKAILQEAEEEARFVVAEAQDLVAKLRIKGDHRMLQAVHSAVLFVLGLEPEEVG